MNLSIVIPTLNEEEGVRKTLKEIFFLLRDKRYEAEVIVVDGGSTDKTVETASHTGATVISSERGYGKQYKIGLNYARGDIVITMDGDGTYPTEEIPRLLGVLKEENLDFISVSRFGPLGKKSINKVNLVGNLCLTFFTNLLFSLCLKDSQSGMWIFRRDVLSKFNLVSDGMAFSEEIKIEAFKKSKAKEVQAPYKKRVTGKSKLKLLDGFKNLIFLFKKKLTDF